MKVFGRFLCEEQGQDLIEYALLGAFISLVCIAGVTLVGTNLNQWYLDAAGSIAAITR